MRARPEGRVILLGATGRMGRLTASAMLRQGLQPLLVGRTEEELTGFADELGEQSPGGAPLPWVVGDTEDPQMLADLLHSSGDVVVSTAGPFTVQDDAAVRAAVDAGCGYLDCSWEPPFLRRLFNRYGPVAESAGAVLLPAFGCHDVAGSLAATIAVRRAMTGSRPPARVDIGYFVVGAGRGATRGGALVDDSYRLVQGRLRTERPGARVRAFDLGPGGSSEGLSLGSAEHFTLPRLAASVTEVNVYVGWFGRLTKAVAMAGAVTGTAARMPGLGAVWESLVRGVSGSAGAPGSGADAYGPSGSGKQRSVVIAETFDADGEFQQRVRVDGPAPQELTASLLAWGAGMLLRGAENGAGALGPAEAFGTEALISGCMALGLAETRHFS